VRLMPEFQKTFQTKENARLYFNVFFDRFDISAYTRNVEEVLDE